LGNGQTYGEVMVAVINAGFDVLSKLYNSGEKLAGASRPHAICTTKKITMQCAGTTARFMVF